MFKRHLLGYQGHQTAPGYKDGTPGINRRTKEIRETILPGICQTMSNPIGHQPHRTPTTSTYPRPATPLVDNDGQQREEPGSMLPQPAFTTAMHSLSALENDIGPLIDPAPASSKWFRARTIFRCSISPISLGPVSTTR